MQQFWQANISSLEKKKQETQALNSQIHPSVCVAGVDAAVTAIAGATAGSSISGKDEQMAKPEVAAAATLADALYMQLLKWLELEHLAYVVSSAIDVLYFWRYHDTRCQYSHMFSNFKNKYLWYFRLW